MRMSSSSNWIICQKFEEQVDNLGPATKDPLESLVVICQHIMSDS